MKRKRFRLRHRKRDKLIADLVDLDLWDKETDSPTVGSLVIIKVYRPQPSIDSEGNITSGTFVAYSAQFKLSEDDPRCDTLDKGKGQKIDPPGPPDFVNPDWEHPAEQFDVGLPNGAAIIDPGDHPFCVWAEG